MKEIDDIEKEVIKKYLNQYKEYINMYLYGKEKRVEYLESASDQLFRAILILSDINLDELD